MEMGGDGRVETQIGGTHLAATAGARHGNPFLGSRIAHHVVKLVLGRGVPAVVEEKAVAGVHGVDVPGQEGGNQVEQRRAIPRNTGEALAAGAGVEEAGQGLGQLLAVVGVRDEVAAPPGDALHAAQRLEGEAAEDVHDKVIGEVGRRRVPLLGARHREGSGEAGVICKWRRV